MLAVADKNGDASAPGDSTRAYNSRYCAAKVVSESREQSASRDGENAHLSFELGGVANIQIADLSGLLAHAHQEPEVLITAELLARAAWSTRRSRNVTTQGLHPLQGSTERVAGHDARGQSQPEELKEQSPQERSVELEF